MLLRKIAINNRISWWILLSERSKSFHRYNENKDHFGLNLQLKKAPALKSLWYLGLVVSQFGHVGFEEVIEDNFGPIRQERVKTSDYTATIWKSNLQKNKSFANVDIFVKTGQDGSVLSD